MLLAGLIAGVGALISDFVIFFFVRHGFSDEVQKLSEEKMVKAVYRRIPDSIRDRLFVAFASFLIASPLPTEIGVTMMASTRKVSNKKFAIIAYVLHTCAIFVILLVGSGIF